MEFVVSLNGRVQGSRQIQPLNSGEIFIDGYKEADKVTSIKRGPWEAR